MDEYEGHLTTLSLTALLDEPGALQTQAHHLTSSLTSLTHTSYPTFLALHQTTTALSHSLADFSSSLSDLISTSLPALQDATAAWSSRTTDVLRERSKARLVLDQHDKIKDLLDIPIFIDSCVRNGYFQEALSLSSHVNTMASRPGAPPILASIHAEVDAAVAQMLVVLLGTLNEPGRKLPALWKAVNFLRKMDAFGPGKDRPELVLDGASGEELLALAFLSGRLTCLAASLEPIARDIHRLTNSATLLADDEVPSSSTAQLSDRDKEDIARYLKKYIDVWREGSYDILTQYSTIFLEQQHSPIPPPRSPTRQRKGSVQPPPSPTPTSASASSLLPLLSPHLLSHLLPLLNSTLPLLPLPLLPSLLTQLTYCATAFTRVGLDFRGLIGNIVSSVVLSAVRQGLQDAGSLLAHVPAHGHDKGKSRSSSTARKPSEWLVTPSALDAPPLPPAESQTPPPPPHIPPQMLAAYPPLAKYTNALLGVLNALRLLAPVAIMYELVDALDRRLGQVGEELFGYLAGFVGGGGAGGAEAEERVARAAGEAYVKVLVPFVRRALVEGVYGVEIAQLGRVDGAGADGLGSALSKWNEIVTT